LPRLALQLDLDKAHRRIAGVDDVVLDPGFATNWPGVISKLVSPAGPTPANLRRA
jgi:hypothetical protein